MKKILFFLYLCLVSFPARAGDKEVFEQIYNLMLNEYRDKISLSPFFDSVFPEVERDDKNIHIITGKKTITVYYKGKIHKIYARPNDETNAKKWAEFTDYLLTEIKKISPELEHKDFELAEVMLYYGSKAFDKNLNYYPMLDVGQKTEKLQGFTATMLEGDILYIRLGTINDYTAEEFNKTLEKYKSPKGIILDLRGNKGGYLKQALKIADGFLSEGVMINTLGRDKGKNRQYSASSGEWYGGTPMAVLVDGETASAAEVIAVALQKNQRAAIIGAQTYGKGAVQNIYQLENEAHFALTTEEFFGKDAAMIEGNGMRPDICSEVYPEDTDIEKILNSKQNFNCIRTARKSMFDLDVALKWLENKIQNKSENTLNKEVEN